MPATLRLPTEIMAQIAGHYRVYFVNPRGDLVYWYRLEDEKALVALCQVSRAWKDVAQPHLWSVIDDPDEPGTLNRDKFLTAMVANPQLGRFLHQTQRQGRKGTTVGTLLLFV
ncbi:hypothetical protein DFS34DRAFT_590118 [Phlyctochytrium arcticum]|nr:hypothetical protein DFS34DRAFT_590118 [Phlyctochytrium arcticum]